MGMQDWTKIQIDNDLARIRKDGRFNSILRDLQPKGVGKIVQELGLDPSKRPKGADLR